MTATEAPPGVPPIAHVVWFGTELPWAYVVSLRSAARRGGFREVRLHHADPLAETRFWPDVVAPPTHPGEAPVVPCALDPEALLGAHPRHGDALVAIYRTMDHHAARANMVRLGLLSRDGGVYLDTDTVTVRDLSPIRESVSFFCGLEPLVFPASVRRSLDPRVRLGALGRTVVRDLCRRVPGGWRAFDAIDAVSPYPRAPNNAVIGAEAGSPFVEELLDRALAMAPARRTKRFALGTHLLQDAVADWQAAGRAGLSVLPPEAFYPLGPEVSQHWFRLGRRPPLEDVVREGTYVVHWYASVRTKPIVPQLDPAYVRRHTGDQLWSALVAPYA